jgi:hypothetical protein
MRKVVVLAVVVSGLVFVASAAPKSSPKKLVGTVGPGFTITLKQGAKKVKKLKPGKYTFVINDKSSIHNFHLTGPGVNKTTSVGAKGKKVWKVKLKKGTYRYVCDPHASQMHGSFRVG